MAEIEAFRAVRYDLGKVGSLSEVIAPPYDVISPEFQDELHEKHPNNFVRLILNKKQPDDTESSNCYTRAAALLNEWQKDGILFTEAQPAIYVYHQQFTFAGREYNRRGFMARLRLSPFGEGKVFPHEETHASAKADRLMLFTTCKANLSQIFGLYSDPECVAQNLLDEAARSVTPIEATDHLGVVSRVWPITDLEVISKVSEVMGPKQLFIADGHHRYETACNYREQIRQMGILTADHPANYVLAMVVAMQDPGLAVMPTHRLFQGLPEFTAEELIAKLGDCFDCRIASQGAASAAELWEEIETADNQGTIALCSNKDKKWIVAELTAEGQAKMAEVASEHNEAWQGLGVSILHRLIIETLLGGKNLPKPNYVHLVDEVIECLESGEYPLAALVMPATVEHIREISMTGERMPAKSTYFYPKLLTGLVINPLE